jgi:hypothetical protein
MIGELFFAIVLTLTVGVLVGHRIGCNFARRCIKTEHTTQVRSGVYSRTANDLIHFINRRIDGDPEESDRYWQKVREEGREA